MKETRAVTPLLLQPTHFVPPNKVTESLSSLPNPGLLCLQGFGNYCQCFLAVGHWEITQQSRAPPVPITHSPSRPHSSHHQQCSHCPVYFSTHTNHVSHYFRGQSTPTMTGFCTAAVVPRPVPKSWRQRACRRGSEGMLRGCSTTRHSPRASSHSSHTRSALLLLPLPLPWQKLLVWVQPSSSLWIWKVQCCQQGQGDASQVLEPYTWIGERCTT